MKKVVSLIASVIIIVFTILFLLLPKSSFSNNENRYLEKIPKISIESIIDGTYMKNFESYVEDHFPFREFFLNLKTNVFKWSGMTKQSDVYFGSDKYLLQEYSAPINNDKIIRIINRFVDNNQDVKIDFIMAPTSIYVNDDNLPKNNVTIDEGKIIDYYKNNLNVNFIDIKDQLKENSDKYLYYKTDHHWTTYGAEQAYLVYCNNKDFTPFNYEYELINNKFYGTLYSKVIDNSLEYDSIYKIKDDSFYDVYYSDKDITTDTFYKEEYLDKKDKYSYFLDNNHDLITITNKSISEENELLVIKDSYANSFIPFITKHYKKIHIIDPRYYRLSISDYIKENNISNVLFLYNILTIDEDLGIISIR